MTNAADGTKDRPAGQDGGGAVDERVMGLVGAEPAEAFAISFDGLTVRVLPGQTVGAALVAAGIRGWRTTRHGGRPRGLFCGIGVCFDCLVTVNGETSVRACLVEARPGDVVTTQHGSGRDDIR